MAGSLSPGSRPVISQYTPVTPCHLTDILQNSFPVGTTDSSGHFRYDARTFSEQKAI